MAIYLANLIGSSCIGVYALATEEIVFLPTLVPRKKAERIREWLQVQLVQSSVGDCVLIGALACANSNGILLPHFIRDGELEIIKPFFDRNITIMETKKTAYGNMVLANNRGAVVDPRVKRSEIQKISDTLGVETVPGEIAGLPYVGSLAFATDNGVVTHPLVKDVEQKLLGEVLRCPVEVGTVNCGIPYVGMGLIGNSHVITAGSLTTGPEIFIIGHAFDVLTENS